MDLRFQLMIDYYAGGFLHALLKVPVILAGKVLRRDHDLNRCSSVTMIKMLGGGSLVIAYPALLAMKNAPQIKQLRLVTTPGVRPFAETLGIFDEIIAIHVDSPLNLLRDTFTAVRKLFRCDAIVDLEVHSRLTTVFSLLTCARNRLGYYTRDSFWRRKLATHLLFCNFTNGMYHSYDQIGSLFGGKPPDLAACQAAFRNAIGAVPALEADSPFRIALAPCCSGLSAERKLRPEEWLTVLERRLRRNGESLRAEIDLFGSPSDRADLDLLAEMIHHDFPEVTVHNLAGELKLADSVRLLARAGELLCIDSSLLHFARLLGVPTVSFWGPSDPRSVLRPWPGNRDEIHYHKLPCSPCVHLSDQAPCGGDNICMRLAVDAGRQEERNPAWVVAGEKESTRFTRVRCP